MCHYQLSDCLRRPVFAAVERLAVRSSLKSVLYQQEQLAVKSGTLTSVYSDLERLKEENWRLERQCNDVSRQLELAGSEIKVSEQDSFAQFSLY